MRQEMWRFMFSWNINVNYNWHFEVHLCAHVDPQWKWVWSHCFAVYSANRIIKMVDLKMKSSYLWFDKRGQSLPLRKKFDCKKTGINVTKDTLEVWRNPIMKLKKYISPSTLHVKVFYKDLFEIRVFEDISFTTALRLVQYCLSFKKNTTEFTTNFDLCK